MNFFFEKNQLILDIKNWLWKYDFGTFWWTIIHRRIKKKVCWFLAKNLAFYDQFPRELTLFIVHVCSGILELNQIKPNRTLATLFISAAWSSSIDSSSNNRSAGVSVFTLRSLKVIYFQKISSYSNQFWNQILNDSWLGQ